MKKYKRAIIPFLFILGLVQFSSAQVSIGFKGGVNYSSVSLAGTGKFTPNIKTMDGFTAGFVAEIPLLNGFAFQPELAFSRKGFRVTDGLDLDLFNLPIPLGAEAHTKINYVEMPLLGKYAMGSERAGVYMLLGPYVGYATNAELQTKARVLIDINLTTTTIDLDNDRYDRWDAGVVGGLGVWVKAGSGKIFFDTRYQQGFTNMFEDTRVDVRMKNRGIGINAGYMIQF